MSRSEAEEKFQTEIERLEKSLEDYEYSEHFSCYTRLECDFCGYTTEWMESMKTHLVTVHGEEIGVLEE